MKKNLLLLAIIVVLQLLARFINGFAEKYTIISTIIFGNTLGRISNLVSFSLFEVVVVLLMIGLIIITIIYKKISHILTYLLAILLAYTITIGISYHRTSYVEKIDMDNLTYGTVELEKLMDYIIIKISNSETNPISISEIKQEARVSMNELIPGYYPNAKELYSSRLFTQAKISGIFSPFTFEANYNKQMPNYEKPFVICHELSHLQGYMSEDESNFIAYLSCINSKEKYFNYSGYLSAFTYVANDLYKSGIDISKYYEKLPIYAYNDLKASSEFWNRYDDNVSNIVNNINDSYLKMNDVVDGVASYSKVVQLIYTYEVNNLIDQ